MIRFILVILLSSYSAFAAESGGSDTGGGSFQRATPEQVRTIFESKEFFDVKSAVLVVAQAIRSRLANSLITDESLKSIFEVTVNAEKWGSQISFRDDVMGSQYYLKPTGLCKYGKGLVNEGSTRIHTLKTPICFSLEALTQLPIQAVPAQLVAIAFHEHAHHFALGNSPADEKLGQDVQNYVLNILIEGTAYDHFNNFVLATSYSSSRNWLNAEFSKNFSAACFKIGSIKEQFRSLHRQIKDEEEDIEKRLLLSLTKQFNQIPSSEFATSVLKRIKPVGEYCENEKAYEPDMKPAIEALEHALNEYWRSANIK